MQKKRTRQVWEIHFKFTDEIAGSEHSNAFDLPDVAHALDAHGRDNAKSADPSSEPDLGGLSQAEQHAHDYAAAAHLPAAASAHHLIL